MEKRKFWFLQKRVYIIAITIVAIGAALTVLRAGQDAIKTKARCTVSKIAYVVADSLDNIRADKRFAIDSMILSELKNINMRGRKSDYVAEKSMGTTQWRSMQAKWKADSLTFARGD